MGPSFDEFLDLNPQAKELSPGDQRLAYAAAMRQYMAQQTQAEGWGAKANEGLASARQWVNQNVTEPGVRNMTGQSGSTEPLGGVSQFVANTLNPVPSNTQSVGSLLGAAVGSMLPGGALVPPAISALGGLLGGSARPEGYDPIQGGLEAAGTIIPAAAKVPSMVKARLNPARALEAEDLVRQAGAYNAMAPRTNVDIGEGQSVTFPGANLPANATQAQVQERMVPVTSPTGITMETQAAFKQAYQAADRLVGDRMVTVPSMNPQGDLMRPVNFNTAVETISRTTDPPLKHQMLQELIQDLRDQARGVPTLSSRGPMQASGLVDAQGNPVLSASTVQTPSVPPRPELALAADILEKVQAPYLQGMSAQRIASAANPAGAEMGGANPQVQAGGPFSLFQRAVRDAMDSSRGIPQQTVQAVREAAQRGLPGTGAIDQLPGYGWGAWYRGSLNGRAPGFSIHPWFEPGKMVGTPEALQGLNYRAPSAGYVPLSLGLTQQLMRGIGQ